MRCRVLCCSITLYFDEVRSARLQTFPQPSCELSSQIGGTRVLAATYTLFTWLHETVGRDRVIDKYPTLYERLTEREETNSLNLMLFLAGCINTVVVSGGRRRAAHNIERLDLSPERSLSNFSFA